MNKSTYFLPLFIALFSVLPLSAGERTIPVDIILMIDKSQSMAEPGKFESMHEWVRNQLIGQILIDGDWITIYQFYGVQNRLLTMTVSGPADRETIVKTVDSIKPDGKYTDLGLALDTIKDALAKRGTNDRHKIMLLLTDMKQEAPWTSPYAGSPETFKSPYLAEARILKHDEWYEITLDMDIKDLIVKTSKELFSSINETVGTPAELAVSGSSDMTQGQNIAIDVTGSTPSGTEQDVNSAENRANSRAAGTGELPLKTLVMVISGIIFICLAAFLFIYLKRKKEREDDQKKKKPIQF